MSPLGARKKPPTAVRIAVPATSANLGPGFDSLGLALDLLNEFTVRTVGRKEERVVGRGTCQGLADGGLFFRAMERVYALARRKRPPVEVTIQGRVPLGRGLGSSATAVVGGGLAANALLGDPFSPDELLGVMTEIEGHPDNVAPALFGGLTASAVVDTGVIVHAHRPDPGWLLALLIPSYELPTAEARKAIPRMIPHKDAVYNLTRLPLVIDAIVEGDADVLGRVLDDRLHEPYRKKFIKGFDAIRRGGVRAGATAVFLSGAGPTMAAFCRGQAVAERVAKAMDRASAFDPSHTTTVLKPRLRGAHVRLLD
jgi:homoserine kinase